jgi:hypothetical protein
VSNAGQLVTDATRYTAVALERKQDLRGVTALA